MKNGEYCKKEKNLQLILKGFKESEVVAQAIQSAILCQLFHLKRNNITN